MEVSEPDRRWLAAAPDGPGDDDDDEERPIGEPDDDDLDDGEEEEDEDPLWVTQPALLHCSTETEFLV